MYFDISILAGAAVAAVAATVAGVVVVFVVDGPPCPLAGVLSEITVDIGDAEGKMVESVKGEVSCRSNGFCW
jgi:hypothetical protein